MLEPNHHRHGMLLAQSKERADEVLGRGRDNGCVPPKPWDNEESRQQDALRGMVGMAPKCAAPAHVWLCGTREEHHTKPEEA
jgi:hypothetical protein